MARRGGDMGRHPGLVAILLIVLAALLPIAVAQEKRITLEHNIPKKVEVGSTVRATLRFIDEAGAALEPYSVEVTVTNPFGVEERPSLTGEGVGVYGFTQGFDVEGAYYVTVRASKYGYVSLSQRLLVDSVKSHAYLDWLFALTNSPVFFVFVMAPVSAFLLYRRVRKAQKVRRGNRR